MTRSFKKSPVRGITTAVSEKPDKVAAHRRTRRSSRQAIVQDIEPKDPKATEDRWDYAKDGKRWVQNADSKTLRK